MNLGEGRSACLSSLSVYPELRAVARVAPLAGLWRCRGGRRCRAGTARLCWVRTGGWSFPGTRGAGLRMEQRQAFITVDEGEGVVMCPSLTLLTVVYGGGGVGKGRGWHLDSLSFSFQGVAPQQRHRACLPPAPRQLCPRAQLPSPVACPPARAKKPLGPPLWQVWAHAPSQESLGGGEQLATGEKMLTPTSQCCGHQTTDPAHHRHAQTRRLACPASVASSHSRTGTGK